MAETKQKASKKEDSFISVQDIKQRKADQSRKNRLSGGSDVVVPITGKVKVRFTKDFKRMKKGVIADVSPFSYEFYDANGVVEKIN